MMGGNWGHKVGAIKDSRPITNPANPISLSTIDSPRVAMDGTHGQKRLRPSVLNGIGETWIASVPLGSIQSAQAGQPLHHLDERHRAGFEPART
jgi:hypothetical protein